MILHDTQNSLEGMGGGKLGVHVHVLEQSYVQQPNMNRGRGGRSRGRNANVLVTSNFPNRVIKLNIHRLEYIKSMWKMC